MVRPARLERATYGFGGRRSNPSELRAHWARGSLPTGREPPVHYASAAALPIGGGRFWANRQGAHRARRRRSADGAYFFGGGIAGIGASTPRQRFGVFRSVAPAALA